MLVKEFSIFHTPYTNIALESSSYYVLVRISKEVDTVNDWIEFYLNLKFFTTRKLTRKNSERLF